MKKICAYCGVEFTNSHKEARFCSHSCRRMWQKRETFRRDERWAAKFGISLDEVQRLRRSGGYRWLEEAERLGISIQEMSHRYAAARYAADKAEAEKLGISSVKEYRRRFGTSYRKKAKKATVRQPKTYAEIRAENRRRQIEAGWRGQVVMGGGGDGARHNDPWLSIHELPRVRDVTRARA